ncbi:four helix bundle protein [Candidatus Bipolaricaulota bacterium]|nr:four helix bundle protein [Candidatus Bipolaricaulota bacterium]
MAIERFEDIEAWRAARKLASSVYAVSRRADLDKDFGLKDQLKRAAASVMANIAEGFDSRSDHEFVRFLSYAYRSASELQSHLYIALDQGYLSETQFNQLYGETVEVKKLINGFIRYLKQKPARPAAPAAWVANHGPATTDYAPRTTDNAPWTTDNAPWTEEADRAHSHP